MKFLQISGNGDVPETPAVKKMRKGDISLKSDCLNLGIFSDGTDETKQTKIQGVCVCARAFVLM